MSVLTDHRADGDDVPATDHPDDRDSYGAHAAYEDPAYDDPAYDDAAQDDPAHDHAAHDRSGYGDPAYDQTGYDAEYDDDAEYDPEDSTGYDPAYDGARHGFAEQDDHDSPVLHGEPGGPGRAGDDGLDELLAPVQLRVDFGDHFEAHYQRLVAHLYAITLNSAEAHDVVREAYSRAWRRWAQVGASPDPTGWVRRVAVRSTMRSWRRVAARVVPGRRRRALVDVGDPRTRTMLLSLGRLSDAERRAVVLVDMAEVPVAEVATLEQVPPGTVAARLSRARRVVGDALVELDPAAPAAHGAYAHGSYAEGTYAEEDDW